MVGTNARVGFDLAREMQQGTRGPIGSLELAIGTRNHAETESACIAELEVVLPPLCLPEIPIATFRHATVLGIDDVRGLDRDRVIVRSPRTIEIGELKVAYARERLKSVALRIVESVVARDVALDETQIASGRTKHVTGGEKAEESAALRRNPLGWEIQRANPLSSPRGMTFRLGNEL
ncbi:MAG: hypothetical protein OK454_08210 [Thaumarchaeota archaeon]|nr:hypothetical protein [Nitrososphaerota archaeon]